jgi:bifunctional N-acetylglucosamine-1-phosphate-uridyltransferase/glucosamine-1-phosphate-acetyltransferase GlmU-like protein
VLEEYIRKFPIPHLINQPPWLITQNLSSTLVELLAGLDSSYSIQEGIAIHSTARIESGVILKPPVIIAAHCFVGAHSYLRGGVYLADSVTIGPGCEIKASVISSHSAAAHFNFIGDSLIGSYVNMEAGSVIANYHNDRKDKRIIIYYEGQKINTSAEKFGALVGDQSKIGANSVLSPGTVLPPGSIVPRLALIDQSM